MNSWLRKKLPSIKYFFDIWLRCIGVLCSIYVVVDWIVKWEYLNYVFLGLVVVAAIYALCKVFRQWNLIELSLSSKLRIQVFFGDLFAEANKETHIVIPVNDFFDTQVDDNIIASTTLHGKFIEKYFPDEASRKHLNEQIADSLSNIEPLDNYVERGKGLPQKRYPLGTCAKVKHSGLTYFLLAMTKFDDNNNAQLSSTEYLSVINSLYKFIDKNNQGKSVAIPLLGAGGMTRLNKSPNQFLYYLATASIFSAELSLNGNLKIVLYGDDKSWTNLSALKTHLKRITDF